MGKRADTRALAGAEGTGIFGAPGSGASNAPELALVTPSKRQAILAGMLEVVGAEGYEHTSVRTVLDRTGVYRQAFYDNFADKDDCYLQAYDAGVERIEALVLAAAADEPGWTGKLRAGLEALLDFLDAEPDAGRGLIVEVHAAGPEALAKRGAAMRRVSLFLDQAREAAAESESPPAIAGEGIAAGIHAVIHSRLATGSSDGFRQLLPEFMYFAVLPYFGAELAGVEMQAAKV
ncbi:MAG: transcriptional regulator, TetR family [Solirubrobacterales bacterium]|nr:transcriptional regulator, TetR family [Solirubrobacterales bacterium]